MSTTQASLFGTDEQTRLSATGHRQTAVYSTRFQGSKRRVLPWLLPILMQELGDGSSVLDGFCGSGVVTYGLAASGAEVTSSDRLLSSVWTARGFVGSASPIASADVEHLIASAESYRGGDVFSTYQGVFYPDNELQWLEGAARFISSRPEEKRGLLYWALFQAALAKRPYNLFHRANLDMRTRDVERTFGNKTTWEKPFPDHFQKFAEEANRFVLERPAGLSLQSDPLDVAGSFDLVYLDPPYINSRGIPTPYDDYYGFLDVLIDNDLLGCIDDAKPHRPIRRVRSAWESRSSVEGALEKLFDRYRSATICVSYRSDGVPTPSRIAELLSKYKAAVDLHELPVTYALSKSSSSEVLIVGT